jgi:hypothetical protein
MRSTRSSKERAKVAQKSIQRYGNLDRKAVLQDAALIVMDEQVRNGGRLSHGFMKFLVNVYHNHGQEWVSHRMISKAVKERKALTSIPRSTTADMDDPPHAILTADMDDPPHAILSNGNDNRHCHGTHLAVDDDGIAYAPQAAADAVVEADALEDEEKEEQLVCRICERGDQEGRPMLRFLPVEHDVAAANTVPGVVTSFSEDIALHIFCGKTASILQSVNQPDLEILTKAGLKNKHGIGAEVNAALARTRCAILSQAGSKEKHYYLVREFEAHLAAIRHTHINFEQESEQSHPVTTIDVAMGASASCVSPLGLSGAENAIRPSPALESTTATAQLTSTAHHLSRAKVGRPKASTNAAKLPLTSQHLTRAKKGRPKGSMNASTKVMIADVEPILVEYCIRKAVIGEPLKKKEVPELARFMISGTETERKYIECLQNHSRYHPDKPLLTQGYYEGFWRRNKTYLEVDRHGYISASKTAGDDTEASKKRRFDMDRHLEHMDRQLERAIAEA